MDRRITLGLVIVLALFGGYIWYTYVRTDAPPVNPPPPQPTPIVFFDATATDVTGLEVHDTEHNATVRVVKTNNTWMMQEPKQGPADSDRVTGLTYDLSHIDASRILTGTTDLKAFGLDPVKYQVKLTLADGTNQTIDLGIENPGQNGYYAKKNNDPTVYLIDTSNAESLEQLVVEPPYTPTPTEIPTGAPTEPATTPVPGGTAAPNATAAP